LGFTYQTVPDEPFHIQKWGRTLKYSSNFPNSVTFILLKWGIHLTKEGKIAHLAQSITFNLTYATGKDTPAMQPDDHKKPLIFISYDTQDIEIVNAIDSVLKRIFSDRVRTFIAKRDIKAGDDAFKIMLHDNLSKSSIILAVCTKRSITSPWLWFESGAGFGSSLLIPIWAGIKPQEFKEPMKIFQGKSIEDKTEMEDLIKRLVEVTKIDCADCSLTDDELAKLKQISDNLGIMKENTGKERLEEIIEFQLAAPNEESPVQYLIEAHFPLSRDIPLQSLSKLMDESKIHIKTTESQFGHDYPFFDARNNKTSNDNVFLLHSDDQHPASNQVRQVMLVKSDTITITYWVRFFQWNSKEVGPKLIYAREINEECIKLFHFYKKLALKLKLTSMNVRIRLFDLQNSVLKTDVVYFQGDNKSYRAPDTNKVEIEQEISVNCATQQEYIELLKLVWEKFRSSDDRYPVLEEEGFLWFEKNKLET